MAGPRWLLRVSPPMTGPRRTGEPLYVRRRPVSVLLASAGVTRGAGVRSVILAAFVVLCLSACQATVRIAVDVGPTGAGTVSVTASFDHDATVAFPDLAQMLQTADLAQAGWRIQGPAPAAGGATSLVVSKSFATPAEAAEVLGELSGPTGPFRDLNVVRNTSVGGTTTAFSGTVDLTCGVACFGDAQLSQTLGANLGFDPAKLQEAGIDPAQLVTFQVAVRLPGALQSSNAPVRTNGQSQWEFKLGAKGTLAVTSRIARHNHRLQIGIAAGVVVVLLIVVIWFLLRRRRRTTGGRRGKSRPQHMARRSQRRAST
jgi:hypothetical protein